MQLDYILQRPIITEKSMKDAANGKFTFLVHTKANKYQIAEAVEELFKVTVVDVATIKISGKIKRFGKRRMESKTSDYKKAIVELKKGQKIDLFDIQEEKKK